MLNSWLSAQRHALWGTSQLPPLQQQHSPPPSSSPSARPDNLPPPGASPPPLPCARAWWRCRPPPSCPCSSFRPAPRLQSQRPAPHRSPPPPQTRAVCDGNGARDSSEVRRQQGSRQSQGLLLNSIGALLLRLLRLRREGLKKTEGEGRQEEAKPGPAGTQPACLHNDHKQPPMAHCLAARTSLSGSSSDSSSFLAFCTQENNQGAKQKRIQTASSCASATATAGVSATAGATATRGQLKSLAQARSASSASGRQVMLHNARLIKQGSPAPWRGGLRRPSSCAWQRPPSPAWPSPACGKQCRL